MEAAKFKPQIVVVGSHVPGIFMRVQRIPKAGETLIGRDYQEPVDGGKGSNQAIAAARLGVRTSFVGCLGRDRLGLEGERWLRDAGVDLSCLYHSETKPTGTGFILLDAEGVPAMAIAMGANEELDEAMVEQALAWLAGARVLLTQFEIRPAVALHVARLARRYGMTAILNPAPAAGMRADDLAGADIIAPNETEARLLLGLAPEAEIEPAEMAGELLRRSGASCALVTLGEKGIAGADLAGGWLEAPPPVRAVDTSGAGDMFCAALAAGIVDGMNYRLASRRACQAAALSVTKPGTIPAYPTRGELEAFISTL